MFSFSHWRISRIIEEGNREQGTGRCMYGNARVQPKSVFSNFRVGWVEERNPTKPRILLGFATLNPTYPGLFPIPFFNQQRYALVGVRVASNNDKAWAKTGSVDALVWRMDFTKLIKSQSVLSSVSIVLPAG